MDEDFWNSVGSSLIMNHGRSDNHSAEYLSQEACRVDQLAVSNLPALLKDRDHLANPESRDHKANESIKIEGAHDYQSLMQFRSSGEEGWWLVRWQFWGHGQSFGLLFIWAHLLSSHIQSVQSHPLYDAIFRVLQYSHIWMWQHVATCGNMRQHVTWLGRNAAPTAPQTSRDCRGCCRGCPSLSLGDGPQNDQFHHKSLC